MKGYIRMSILIVTLLGLLTMIKVTEATEWIINPANGHSYKFVTGCGHWHDCEDVAVSEGAHLVTINSEEEQVWLNNTFGMSNWHAWIGFTDELEEGNWVWISGEPVTYTNWLPGEPNNAYECGEDYAHLGSGGQWNDLGYCGYDWFRVTNAIIEMETPDITGCINLQGSPLVGRKVILRQPYEPNQITKTDANGCYKFDNAVSGKPFGVIIRGPVVP